MKKYWYIAMMVVCTLMIGTACGDDDDDIVVDEAWKLENEQAFSKIALDSKYKEIKSEGNEGSIYYKVLKEGTGEERIYYTSKVKAYYTGSIIREYAESALDGIVFDTHEPPYEAAVTFSVNGVISGWATALQHMKVGDRWEVWIPQQLGYGSTGTQNYYKQIEIPPYSTLKFEMEVVEIVEQ